MTSSTRSRSSAAARLRATATARGPSSTSRPARAAGRSSRAAPAWAPPGVYGTLEGPLGAGKQGSWLVSARKSYLDYVLDRLDVESGTVIGYYDVTGRLALHPSPTQTIGLTLLHGRSKWREGDQSDPNEAESARAGSDVGVLQWRHDSPAWRLGLQAFATHETGRNVDGPVETFRSTTDQWGFRADASRGLGAHRLEGGLLLRHARRAGGEPRHRQRAPHDRPPGLRRGRRAGGRLRPGHLGARGWPRERDRGRPARLLRRDGRDARPPARLRPGHCSPGGPGCWPAFGDYAQFPSFEALHGQYGNPDLDAERSRHFTLALEQGLGERTRVRVDAYDQEEDGLLYAPGSEWRRVDGRIVVRRPPRPPPQRAHRPLARDRGPPPAAQRQRPLGLDRLQLREGAPPRRDGAAWSSTPTSTSATRSRSTRATA